MKDNFCKIFRDNIKRDGAENLLKWLEKSDFFTAPASTRFHGTHEGGLVEHSINVYERLKHQLEHSMLNGKYSDETIAIVGLLHDICKVNFYKKDLRNVKVDGVWIQKEIWTIDEKVPIGHSEKSIILIQKFMDLTMDEIYAIRAHMGSWDDSAHGKGNIIGGCFEKCPLAVYTHIADTEATYILEEREK